MITTLKKDIFNWVFLFLGGVILLFIVAPFIGIYFETPLKELIDVSLEAEVQNSIWLTIWTSMAGTFLCAVFSIPLSYILARKNFPLKKLVNGVIDLPIIIPHSAAGIAILGMISRDSVIGSTAKSMGFSFVGNPAGIMLAMAFVSVPFLINAARDGFSAVPEKYEKAALNLGASQTRVFFTVSLPLAWRSILSGLILMWARGMSEFGAVIIVAYHPITTPVMIYERFTSFGLKYSMPVTVLFITICLGFFLAFRLIGKKRVDT
ncbi:MAG: ABC transporter permease [Rhodothermaceae bacterium]